MGNGRDKKPDNFWQYLQSLPATSEIHVAQERYGRALDALNGIEALFVELGSAATALRSLLQSSSDSELPAVAKYASMLAADAEVASIMARCPLLKKP